MKYEDAIGRVRDLLKGADLISFKFDRDYQGGKVKISLGVITIFPDPLGGVRNTVVSFYGKTWAEVIKKIEIYVVPEGIPTESEAPEDDEIPKEGGQNG